MTAWPGLDSHLDWGYVDPATLAPALQRAFCKLHALGAFQQRVSVGRILADMSDEHFPLLLEAVVIDDVFRNLLPISIEVMGTLLVRIPNRPRRRLTGLDDAIGETRHRRAVGAVDLESDEVVTIDPRHPAHVDMRDHAALEPESGVGGIISGRGVFLALLVETFGNVCRAEAGDTLDFAEQIVEHVAPVADHVEDDAAAV